jgi:hypothetical protein
MTHTLSVTDVGDFHKKSVVPQILLKGKWLTEAGFTPDQKVEISQKSKGVLVINLKISENV